MGMNADKNASCFPARCPVALLILFLTPLALMAQNEGAEGGNNQFAENEKGLSAERVREAIDSGIIFLRRAQSEGDWDNAFPVYRGGVNALCCLAMLTAGVPPEDPAVQSSMASLDRMTIEDSSIYAVSLMTMVYCLADADTRKARIRECAEFLVDSQLPSGGWTYQGGMGRGMTTDSSNTQFALLALHEAALVGIEIPRETWLKSRDYWLGVRDERTGGFAYGNHSPEPSGSMTCAGISSLLIIDENLEKPVPLANGRIVCCAEQDRLAEVDAASAWLARNFTVRSNPSNVGHFRSAWMYYLYGMERAARLSGQRFFGQHDWYRAGAMQFLRNQGMNGSFTGRSHGENDPNIATAYALLFLSKGKRPVVIGKYSHGDGGDWDRHRQGVHYLVRRLERDWSRPLNWQTIDSTVATADDLLEAPVLFLSGRDELRLNETQKKALREYVDYGGLIFAEACQGDGCGDDVPFDRSFRALMEELFPSSPLRLLEASHPVYSAWYPIENPNPDRPLWGLQSSCRTSVIYCPRNLAGLWQHNRASSLKSMPPGAAREVEYCVRLGANVLAYATGRDLKEKLDRPKTLVDNEFRPGARTPLIPKLAHNGGDDDAPNAWQNIVRRAQHDLGQRFRFERRMIEPSLEQLADYPMVFMHGRSAFSWSEEQRLALREYLLNRGGFLFADSICTSSQFNNAFRDEIARIIPEASLQVIPPEDPIWSKDQGGYDLKTVGMHTVARGGGVSFAKVTPQIEGVRLNNRWVVIFSPHDLSCAMENASPAQCPGYDKDDAARLGVNIILYALMPGS
jgi:Domain of unknown function (DUF4159)